MSEQSETGIVDLINAKFDGVNAQLKTLAKSVDEIKETCKERGKGCRAEMKGVDARLDILERAKAVQNSHCQEKKEEKRTRFDKYQILAQGASGMLGVALGLLFAYIFKV